MNAVAEKFRISEAFPNPDKDVEAVSFQLDTKDLAFWDAENIARSVKRYKFQPRTTFSYENKIDPTDISKVDSEVDQVLISFPAVFSTRSYGEKAINTLQEWECVVREIVDDTVFADAISVIDSNSELQFLEIPLSDFSPDDAPLLSEGVIFRLIVAFTRRANGSSHRECIIYIRKILPRVKEDIEDIVDMLTLEFRDATTCER